jgi:hypothetical protein
MGSGILQALEISTQALAYCNEIQRRRSAAVLDALHHALDFVSGEGLNDVRSGAVGKHGADYPVVILHGSHNDMS